ncbi:MAG: tRNA epoxyqueuosine(34) reductase QueG [Planctomycetes bacterium]|nr:tRNA epoxyqueuosine(34) reductase QueG [Planctomycetota bacterium]MCW8137019.1 tRNA epoxyqueuosine(34) reductase QueG [Planctomycetota bacterium]
MAAVTSSALKDAVIAAARRQDFLNTGVCSAARTPHADFLDTWLARGWHGTMDWLERTPDWRKDISTRYPWARSYLAISIDYPSQPTPNGIARYAFGPDYHEVYKPRLKQLEDDIIGIGGPGTRALWYQDTGPFLERAIAHQAGLGWVGKNTMLISPERGSWTLLALVLTSLELPPDPPGTDHCGNCTRCLDACPTQAFPAPYQLNASRCVSYLTIEHAGAVSQELRAEIGNWLYGCDICNEVCPWNSKAPEMTRETPNIGGLTVAKILTSKPEHLRKRIAGTPLARTGVAKLRVNAAIVAGNQKDERTLPSLEQALQTEDEELQEAVVWALRQFNTPKARSLLARAQKYVTNEELRESIIQTLQQQPPA